MVEVHQAFPLIDLMRPALVILVLGFAIAFWVTGRPNWSLFVATVKAALFTVYYGVFFDGTFTFLDDWSYVEGGQHLVEQGVSTINLISHLPELFSLAGGIHFTYYLFNADAFRILGDSYYSPVSINVVLTFLAAGLMTFTARSTLACSRSLSTGLFVFLVIQPNLLAWSTIMNGKDTLVLVCTAAAVYGVTRLENGYYFRAVVLFIALGLMLFFTRFYLPVFFLVALFGALLFSPGGRRRWVWWLLVPVGLIGVFTILGTDMVFSNIDRLQEGFTNPTFGLVRFILTPAPFNTTENYAFLNLPQVFHWMLMPAMVFGIYRIWGKTSLTAKFIVIYFLGMILFYGMFENLQGPRHRYQLEGIIALFQFYGIVGILKQLLYKSRPSNTSPSVSYPSA